MIDINERFAVAAASPEVYAVLSDPSAVVECVAGAELGKQHEDGSYDAKMTVKFSALRVSFAGKVRLELDEDNRSGTVKASGRDGQGGTKFQATATFQVTPEDGGVASSVIATGQVVLSGKLASVIEGAATAVVRRMTADFVEALSVMCASGSDVLGPATPPVVDTAAGTTPATVSGCPAPASAAATAVPRSAPESSNDAAVAEPPAPAAVPVAAVLMLHGYGGSPNSLRPLGQALADAGYAVTLPRLPGHGSRWKELGRTRWPDWYQAADAALQKLAGEHAQVFVMGLDLGATLALRLAEQRTSAVSGLVLINPILTAPLGTPKPLGLVSLFRRSTPAVRHDVKKPGTTEVGYERLPLKATKSLVAFGRLVRDELGRLSCPTLLVTSPQGHVVAVGDSARVWAGLTSADKRQCSFEDSYHVLTLDNDAPALASECVDFVRAHVLVSRP
jgi:esterase/lipase/carbon monoxide dehydrogenase subunit G